MNNTFNNIAFELNEKIFKYLSHYDLLNLRITNKKFYKLINIHLEEYFITKRIIENMQRINNHEENIKKIINKSFPDFPVNTFKLHKYDNEGAEFCDIINFTYFYNDHYHNIQLSICEDRLVIFVIYVMLKGKIICNKFITKVLATRIDNEDYDENGNLLFDNDYKEIINNKDNNLKKLSKKMGFESSYLEIYEMVMNINSYYLKNNKNTKKIENIFSDINNMIMQNLNLD